MSSKNKSFILIILVLICFFGLYRPLKIETNHLNPTESIIYIEETINIIPEETIGESIILPEEDFEIEVDQVYPLSRNKIDINQYERDLFAKLIYMEAGAEGFDGMAAVAQVVINRMKYYNMTIEETVLETGVFSVTTPKKTFFNCIPSDYSYEIVDKFIDGYIYEAVGNSLFFVMSSYYREGVWHYDYDGKTIKFVLEICGIKFFELR